MSIISDRKIVFLTLLVMLALSSLPARAASAPCMGNDTTVEGCQIVVHSDETAPDETISSGIRLNKAVTNILFNSFTGACRFVDNASTDDLFVPQATVDEFLAFTFNPPLHVGIANCTFPVAAPGSPFSATSTIPFANFDIFEED
ncbi:MAG: hypothetical protein AB7H77_05535, partial [Bdellovibrionales bacterium]